MVARKKLVTAGAALVALGSTITIGLVGNSPAQAEPKQYDAGVLMGFGSDTIQEVTNALGGFSNGTGYAPILAHTVTGAGKDVYTEIASWDAINPDTGNKNDCITTKLNGPLINRPNGSGGGRGILSVRYGGGQPGRNSDGSTGTVQTRWGTSTATNAACATKVASPLVDFARSSSTGGSSTTTAGPLTYAPFVEDALGFAYYDYSNTLGGTPPTLLLTQLHDLFQNGPTSIGGTLYLPCDIQSSSGTRADFLAKLGTAIGTGALNNATEACRWADSTDDFDVAHASETASVLDGQVEENKGVSLQNKGLAIKDSDPVTAGDQVYTHPDCDGDGTVDNNGATATPCTNAVVVIGFSVSAFVSKSNNVSPNSVGGANLGNITIGASTVIPYTGTAPSLSANPAYYASSMGRAVYFVLATSVLNNDGSNGLKAMFTNGTYPDGDVDAPGTGGNVDGDSKAEICEANAQSIAQSFGFVKLTDIAGAEVCGSVTRQGPYDTSQPS